MDVKWQFFYWPLGNWVDPEGNAVAVEMPFRAKHCDRVLLVTPSGISGGGGHGEPSMSGVEPKYFDSETLKPFDLPDGDFITVIDKEA